MIQKQFRKDLGRRNVLQHTGSSILLIILLLLVHSSASVCSGFDDMYS